MKKHLVYFYIISLFVFLTNCAKVHKGYKIEDDVNKEMISMVEQKKNLSDFIVKFGSPSFINSPINDTICYIYIQGKKVAFNRFYKPTHQYICINFKNNIADSYNQKTLTKLTKEKMKRIDINLKKPL